MESIRKEYVMLGICGIIAALVVVTLAFFGNPGNMAICVACFVRDTAGALKLHSAETVQYFRPEIAGMIIGAFVMALASKEFKVQAGASPFTRFALGFIMMIGCLIFLGCPLRLVLRMAAGDLNAWIALPGFAAGILTGAFFLKKGFSLGKAQEVKSSEGYVLPIIMAVLLVIAVATTLFAASVKGPGSLHAPVLLSIIGGLMFGALSQRARLCFAGSLRNAMLVRDFKGLIVIGFIFVAMLGYALVTDNFKLSMAEQPIAHSEALWNILGMYVAGFAATLVGGCPLRQLILAGSGSGDGAVTFIGLLVGAAFAHNFGIASSPTGATLPGQIMTVACIVVLFVIAAVNLKRTA